MPNHAPSVMQRRPIANTRKPQRKLAAATTPTSSAGCALRLARRPSSAATWPTDSRADSPMA
ncbi:Uncharacterised protein [Mycobacteroides abscessus subsp. abscessus]|nr:Uncharacterised protein [Mycobacteroides abscessus subsp. abscessus]